VILRVLDILDDVPNDALFVYDKGDTGVRETILLKYTKGFGRLKGREVGYYGKGQPAVVGEGLLGRCGIGAGTQDLGIELLELREQALEFPQLPLSAACKGANVKR